MCANMVDIQSAMAEISRKKKEDRRNHNAKRKNREETTRRKYNVHICYAGQP